MGTETYSFSVNGYGLYALALVSGVIGNLLADGIVTGILSSVGLFVILLLSITFTNHKWTSKEHSNISQD